MEKRGLIITVLLLSLFLAINIVSAEITITQPASVYNYGDSFDLSTTINSSAGETNSFSLDLICGDKSINLMDISQLWLKTGKKTLDYSLLLSKNYLNGMTGDCFVSAKYGGLQKDTNYFLISNNINVATKITNMTINPGENITILGTAIKENLVKANGYVDLTLENTTLSSSTSVRNGRFSITIITPSNIKSGEYNAKVYVYEENNDEIINSGEAAVLVIINQKPTELDLELNKNEILPIENITLLATIFDQAEDIINNAVAIKVYDTNNKVIYEKSLNPEENVTLTFLSNQTPGGYKVEAKAFSLSSEKVFIIDNYEKVDFVLNGSILNVKNIGNVIFNKSLEVKIGEETRLFDIVLGLGKEKNLSISAPNGEYNIMISDGIGNITANNVALTGNAINIGEVKQILTWRNYVVLWGFLLLLVILIIIVLSRKASEKKRAYGSLRNERIIKRGGIERATPELKTRTVAASPEHVDKRFAGIHAQQAQHEIELKGKDENVAVLAIKLDNPDKVSKVNKESFEKILQEIKESKGSIYQSGDYLLSIYASVNTRTFENEKIAVRVAEKVGRIITEHNKKFNEKITSGISVHNGNMILRKEDKIKFSVLGNTLSLTKRLADISLRKDGVILLSEDTFKKLMSTIKAERRNIDGIIAYSLEKSIMREDNARFVNGFLKRNKF
jgi:hypothetical protein